MSATDRGIKSTKRPKPDKELVDIAKYVAKKEIKSDEAYETARYCLMDTLACGMLALQYPACTKLLGPVVPGAQMADGARVPGTPTSSTPSRPPSTSAPWSAGSTSTTLGSPPSGATLRQPGGILAVADYLSRQRLAQGKKP